MPSSMHHGLRSTSFPAALTHVTTRLILAAGPFARALIVAPEAFVAAEAWLLT